MEIQKITPELTKSIYKPAAFSDHKGSRGHALLIGGSYGKIGAITLASRAALHSGCGLVSAFIPECGYQIVQTAFPEAMVITDNEGKYISNIQFDIVPQAIGIGPGIGQEQATQKALEDFLKTAKSPLVIDADAINILSKNKPWLEMLPKNAILTPHVKEFERLVGVWKSQSEKIDKAIVFSKKFGVIIVLKGAPTLIVSNSDVFENSTGNASLATAGSGDVLTGILTGLLAQSYSALDAAKLGVYLHGLTADLALSQIGTEAFIASDIIVNLGRAFLSFH